MTNHGKYFGPPGNFLLISGSCRVILKDDEPVTLKYIEHALQSLKDADLIKEKTAPIEDFNTYYVTAGGLDAERKLRLLANTGVSG